MEDLVLTDEEDRIVREGDAASSLLDNPAFLLAIERLRKQCADKILESAPDKAADRENLYNLSRGLSAVTEELLAMANLATTTIDNAKRLTPDHDVQDHPDADLVDY
jgi:hypothetical protein